MKYLITSKKKNITSKMFLTYNEIGELEKIEFENCNPTQVNWLMDRVPVLEALLEHKCQQNNLNLATAEVDLSFENFWNTYAYKVGKRERTRRLWESLTKIEKAAVFVSIPKYHRFVKIMDQQMAYAETWLNNRMWENEYIVK
jgi:hypothetical protein